MKGWHLIWILPLAFVLIMAACGFILARIMNLWMDHEG